MRQTRFNPRNLRRAKNIQQTLGTWVAARFLAKRGWSLEAAMWTLCRKAVR